MTSSLTKSLTNREDVQMRSAYPSTRLAVADLEQVQVINSRTLTRLGSSRCRIMADQV